MADCAASRGDVLVLGDYRQTLTVVRSLSRAGYRPVLGQCGKGGMACDSRHVAEVWHHPPAADDSARRFCRALSSYLASNPAVRCVFPVGEKEVSFLTRHHELLPTSVEYTMPGEPVVNACLNKIATLDLLGELDIPHAEYRIATGKDEVVSAIEAVGYPCVIKPESEQTKIFGLKALVLHSPEEFKETLSRWPEGSANWIVQKYFDGPRHNVYFFAKDGQLQSRVEVRIDRTDRVDGTGYAVEGVSVPPTDSLSEYTARLAERLDYTGAGCAQYLVDGTGLGRQNKGRRDRRKSGTTLLLAVWRRARVQALASQS